MDYFAEAADIAVDGDMVHVTWTVGDPPRTQAIMHMPRQRWRTFVTAAFARLDDTAAP